MIAIVDKIKENRLKWLDHVLRREGIELLRVLKIIYIVGKRETEDQKMWWM